MPRSARPPLSRPQSSAAAKSMPSEPMVATGVARRRHRAALCPRPRRAAIRRRDSFPGGAARVLVQSWRRPSVSGEHRGGEVRVGRGRPLVPQRLVGGVAQAHPALASRSARTRPGRRSRRRGDTSRRPRRGPRSAPPSRATIRSSPSSPSSVCRRSRGRDVAQHLGQRRVGTLRQFPQVDARSRGPSARSSPPRRSSPQAGSETPRAACRRPAAARPRPPRANRRAAQSCALL